MEELSCEFRGKLDVVATPTELPGLTHFLFRLVSLVARAPVNNRARIRDTYEHLTKLLFQGQLGKVTYVVSLLELHAFATR